MNTLSQHVLVTIGVNPDVAASQANVDGLIRKTASNSALVCQHLYEALVGLAGDLPLGSRLTVQQLANIQAVANQSLAQARSTVQQHAMAELAQACAKYLALFQQASRRAPAILKKANPGQYAIHSLPRHTLVSDGQKLYEVMTWMSADEIERLNARVLRGETAFALESDGERSRSKIHFGAVVEEDKVCLGQGAFGKVVLGRCADTDQYVAIKKAQAHPAAAAAYAKMGKADDHLQPVTITQFLNDGSEKEITQVMLSFPYQSSRQGGININRKALMTISELGVTDLQCFLERFNFLRWVLTPGPKPFQVESERLLQQLAQTIHVGEIPFSNPKLTRQFLNRMAYQMLECVHKMHQRGVAHNDIKPDNFVLAFHKGNLRIKLIDFDMNIDIKAGIGVPRSCYMESYASPQVRSSEANNHPRLNDAFSVGMTIRNVLGLTTLGAIDMRGAMVGRTATGRVEKYKPVQHRRDVEAREIVAPSLLSLLDVSDLLIHPHSGKRITVEEAMNSPVFGQAEAMVSNEQFSELCFNALHCLQYLNSDALMVPLGLAHLNSEHAVGKQFVEISNAVSQKNMASVVDGVKQQFIDKHGQAAFDLAMREAAEVAEQGNAEAHRRRFARAINPVNLFRSADKKEALYKYTSSKR
ncbi:MAG TPA: hypothetical protein VFV39_11560 [Limnobacter sp.]|nr:hypothetical protein [Limnobacter sp.]